MNIICKICDNESNNLQSFSKHILNHGYNGILKYYIDYDNFKIPKCECGKDRKLLRGIEFRKTCGSKDCLSLLHKNRKMSNNVKNKISLKMIESHKNGIHPGWSFINKDINKRSYPEKWFIKNVLHKFDLYSKYTIVEKMSFHKYFLDFAILDMKIDIEIDGQQHFRNSDSIKHDENRDNFLLENNWRVYRIAWLELKNKPDEIIKDLLFFIKEQKLYRKYNVDEVKKNIKKTLKYGSREKYSIGTKEKSYLKYEPLMKIIKDSNINFSKFGWVKEVSILTGIKYQKVSYWMNRYMKDFYDEKCFKRKIGPVV